jgi:hypothetical protein
LRRLRETPGLEKRWISKVEASLSTDRAELISPNYTITNRLLDVRFALKEVVITDQFLVELQIQAHARRAKEMKRVGDEQKARGRQCQK